MNLVNNFIDIFGLLLHFLYICQMNNTERWTRSYYCESIGHKKQDLSLKDREYICENCGVVIIRDWNASKNILTEGIRLYRTKHKTNIQLAI